MKNVKFRGKKTNPAEYSSAQNSTVRWKLRALLIAGGFLLLWCS